MTHLDFSDSGRKARLEASHEAWNRFRNNQCIDDVLTMIVPIGEGRRDILLRTNGKKGQRFNHLWRDFINTNYPQMIDPIKDPKAPMAEATDFSWFTQDEDDQWSLDRYDAACAMVDALRTSDPKAFRNIRTAQGLRKRTHKFIVEQQTPAADAVGDEGAAASAADMEKPAISEQQALDYLAKHLKPKRALQFFTQLVEAAGLERSNDFSKSFAAAVKAARHDAKNGVHDEMRDRKQRHEVAVAINPKPVKLRRTDDVKPPEGTSLFLTDGRK